MYGGSKKSISKHATDAETHYITQIWDSVPEQLSREDKRFVHADVGRNVRAPQLRGPIRWLEDAALVQTVPRVRKSEMPLSAYKDGAFKLFFVDVGLLAAPRPRWISWSRQITACCPSK